MRSSPQAQSAASPVPAWPFGVAGVAVPAAAMLLLADDPDALAQASGAILATGAMAAGIIGAAIAGRLWTGIALALLAGAALLLLGAALGAPPLLHPAPVAAALVIASLSFAARGALFARSSGARGWWIAIAVVAGEAAVVATAAARPGALPDWLLALLPAQWATTAMRTALTGGDAFAANAALLALCGTAATTLLVTALWPRRWPYLLMFTAWIGLSALVYDAGAPLAQGGASRIRLLLS